MILRTNIIGLALAFGLGAQVAAQTPQADIRGVIQSQLDALQADDFATAFSFASPTIQQLFGSPERFGQMVQNGYPMVWRPANVEFSSLTERGGRLYQSLLVTDRAGKLHLLEYEMVQTGDGWEINGVQFKRPGSFGA